MKNKYVSHWNQTPQQSQKLSFYCFFFCRFRKSSHQLRIETARYENIPRNERIYHFCTSNKMEDQNHFLLDLALL